MDKRQTFLPVVLALCMIPFTSCSEENKTAANDKAQEGIVYQASTLNALMLGNFDKTVIVKDFLSNGDTGLGTYEGADGEAIFIDGAAYQATADGTVNKMADTDKIAFGAIVSFNKNEKTVSAENITSIEDMKSMLDTKISENTNYFYVVKIHGNFEKMHVRSCYKSEKPYPTLSEATANQREFEYENTSGTVVAMYCPDYVEGINLPGWHLHYIDDARKIGGHVLDLSLTTGTMQMNAADEFHVVLPENDEFSKLNLAKDMSDETNKAENQK